MNKVGGGDPKNSLYCSFCGKSQHEVESSVTPRRCAIEVQQLDPLTRHREL